MMPDDKKGGAYMKGVELVHWFHALDLHGNQVCSYSKDVSVGDTDYV